MSYASWSSCKPHRWQVAAITLAVGFGSLLCSHFQFFDSDRSNQWPDRWEDSHVVCFCWGTWYAGIPFIFAKQNNRQLLCWSHHGISLQHVATTKEATNYQLVPVEHGDSPAMCDYRKGIPPFFQCVTTNIWSCKMLFWFRYGDPMWPWGGPIREPWGLHAAASNAAPKPSRIFWDAGGAGWPGDLGCQVGFETSHGRSWVVGWFWIALASGQEFKRF